MTLVIRALESEASAREEGNAPTGVCFVVQAPSHEAVVAARFIPWHAGLTLCGNGCGTTGEEKGASLL
mgnify:CR=1 FL=1